MLPNRGLETQEEKLSAMTYLRKAMANYGLTIIIITPDLRNTVKVHKIMTCLGRVTIDYDLLLPLGVATIISLMILPLLRSICFHTINR